MNKGTKASEKDEEKKKGQRNQKTSINVKKIKQRTVYFHRNKKFQCLTCSSTSLRKSTRTSAVCCASTCLGSATSRAGTEGSVGIERTYTHMCAHTHTQIILNIMFSYTWIQQKCSTTQGRSTCGYGECRRMRMK